MFLKISSASFVETKANYEISSFGEGVGGRHKVGGFRQKREVGIDKGYRIFREGGCVGEHRYFS